MFRSTVLFRMFALTAAIIGIFLVVTACNSTGTGTLEGQFGPIRGTVTVESSPKPDNEGRKIGTWVDDDGTEYDLYDLDGDGKPDIAKGPDGKWYIITDMIFYEIPDAVKHPFGGGYTLVLGPASDLDQAFDFTGSTTDDLLMEFGWWGAEEGDEIETTSYTDGQLYAGRIMEMYFVISTQQGFPGVKNVDVEVAVKPLMLDDTRFRVYGVGIKGHAVEVTEFAAKMGVTQFDFDFGGVHVSTTIDHPNRTAYAYADGVLFDVYGY